MGAFMKKLLWLAAIAGVGYLGYQEAPGLVPSIEIGHIVSAPSSSASEASARTLSVNCVDVNRADYQELQRIRYVNPIRAKTILEMRIGQPFRTLDDLTRVKGISPHRVQEIRREGVACVR